jgi:preprotein translocase SecE subunit
MAGYKKDQGRMARMATFWSLAALIFYGCLSLRAELAGRFSGSLGSPLIEAFPTIPVLGVQLTAAFLIVALLFAAAIWLLYRWVEKPRNADLLIETEAELRKVTWPTGKEVIGSSTVVILAVVFLMAFLAGADLLLARIARVIFGG